MTQTPSYAFNWKEYLRFCTRLEKDSYFSDDNLEESAVRTSISRAYYSAFQHSYFFIVKKFSYKYPAYIGSIGQQVGMHEDFFYFIRNILVSSFSEPKDKDLFTELAIKLKDLKLLREKADYKENVLGSRMYKDEKKAIFLAKDIHKIIDYLKEKYPL